MTRLAPWAKSSSSASGKVRKAGATTTSANPPLMQHAATRSPSDRPEPSGALRTTPPMSDPGTNGRSGLYWYSPRVWSTSGKATPAACTSITTPEPGVSGCSAGGSGRSATDRADPGPLSSGIWSAFIRIPAQPAMPAAWGGGRNLLDEQDLRVLRQRPDVVRHDLLQLVADFAHACERGQLAVAGVLGQLQPLDAVGVGVGLLE